MLVFKILIPLLFSLESISCEILWDGDVVILSGPISHYLSELGLLKDKKIKGISSFTGFNKSEVSGEILGGGIFIGPKYFKGLINPLIMYDSSLELKNALNKVSGGKKISIETNGMDPFEVYELVKKEVSPFIKTCSASEARLDEWVGGVRNSWVKINLEKEFAILFLLGEIGDKKTPPLLLMNQDGFSKFLKGVRGIKGYPGPLPYLSWSKKVIGQMELQYQTMIIGLVQDKKQEVQGRYVSVAENAASDKISTQKRTVMMNIYNSSFLIPGLPQIYFLKELKGLIEIWKKEYLR